MHVYEVTAAGFTGDGSTDDRVVWVSAPDEETLLDAIEMTGAKFWGRLFKGEHVISANVDFKLPDQESELRAALLKFKEKK